MLRAAFSHKNDGLVLKLEGRLVGAWAVQVKSLLSRHFVSNGLLVDVTEVTYVDSVGEQLFLWLRDLQAKFVAETCYARDVCERLQLDLKRDLKEKETLTGASCQRPRCFPRKPQCPSSPPGRSPLNRLGAAPSKGQNMSWTHSDNEQRDDEIRSQH
jgi:hypothetical protein